MPELGDWKQVKKKGEKLNQIIIARTIMTGWRRKHITLRARSRKVSSIRNKMEHLSFHLISCLCLMKTELAVNIRTNIANTIILLNLEPGMSLITITW